jgi:hypothetical protein
MKAESPYGMGIAWFFAFLVAATGQESFFHGFDSLIRRSPEFWQGPNCFGIQGLVA